MDTTELAEDYVFLTGSHDHGATEAIWLTKRYDPATYYVQFYRVEPGEKVGIVTVHCTPLAETLTRVQVSYEYIPLSDKGREFIEGFTAAVYENFIGEWELLLLRYFEGEGQG